MSVTIDRRMFTVDEYHQMAASGILTEDDRVELINGEIISMRPINSPHASVVDRISNLLMSELGRSAIVRVQSPLQIPEHSEPEPDVILLAYRHDFYATAHPQPDDVYLLIEVADSSLSIDRELKLPLYAQASVLEVWIVNLIDQQIEMHRSPSAEGYQEITVAQRGEKLTIPNFSRVISVEDLIGPSLPGS